MVKDNFTYKIKRRLSAIFVLLLFIAYYISTDPDFKLFQDLTFGVGLILTLNIFVVSMASIIMVEFLPDFFIDVIYGKEEKLRERAVLTSEGASNAMIAKSIRILAYSLIIASAIISYNIS